MTIFAKTFVIDDSQILIFWEYDPDKEYYVLQLKTNIDGIGTTLGIRIDDKDKVIQYFNKLDEIQSKKLLDNLKQQIDEDDGENES